MANWLNETFYNIDYAWAKFFHILYTHCGKPLTYVMDFISVLGKSGIVLILISLIFCIFPKTRRAGVCAIIAIAISSIISGLILKPIVARARPYTHEELDYYNWWLNVGAHTENSFSFPSGHTTATMAFAFALFSNSDNKKIGLLYLIFPILMMFSRTYLMVHYFSDCLFGLLVGTIGAVIAYYLTYLLFVKTKGKFNNFINNFELKDLFKKKSNN